jgi:predicted adenylyl cyclase CyaB
MDQPVSFMARNIEIKAHVADPQAMAARAASLADSGPIDRTQDDVFFACANGRLKLRDFGDGSGDLIYYSRPDQAGPKESFYIRTPTRSPDSLRESLTLACGVTGRVLKQRRIYLVGQTRVHLDHVEGLGHFVELEVVLRDEQSTETGTRIAQELMTALGIPADSLVEMAYVDLLRQAEARQP